MYEEEKLHGSDGGAAGSIGAVTRWGVMWLILEVLKEADD